MTFLYATKGRRFLALLVDFVLLSVVANYFGTFVERLFGYDPESTSTYYQLALSELSNLVDGGTGTEENLMLYLQQYYLHLLIDRAFSLGILLILIVGLLVVLPIFWNGNTLGRKLTHLTLVDQKGNPATAKNFILREIVGTFIFYGVFGGFAIFVSLILVIVKNRSLVDYISSTHLVFDKDFVESIRGYSEAVQNQTRFEDDNNIEADYTEVKEEKEQDYTDNTEDDDEDDYKII